MSESASHAPRHAAESPRANDGAGTLRPSATLLVLVALCLAWVALMRRFNAGDIYSVLGPYACLVSAVACGLYWRALRSWFRVTPRAVIAGGAVGVGMTLLTYPVFRFAVQLEPGLEAQVRGLYIGAQSTTLARALCWVVMIILSEELLFRGAGPATLRNYMPERAAFGVSLVVYALAQAGTGSWIVMAMALGCGALWSLLRYYTGSLVAPLIAHLIWSPVVIILHPVT